MSTLTSTCADIQDAQHLHCFSTRGGIMGLGRCRTASSTWGLARSLCGLSESWRLWRGSDQGACMCVYVMCKDACIPIALSVLIKTHCSWVPLLKGGWMGSFPLQTLTVPQHDQSAALVVWHTHTHTLYAHAYETTALPLTTNFCPRRMSGECCKVWLSRIPMKAAMNKRGGNHSSNSSNSRSTGQIGSNSRSRSSIKISSILSDSGSSSSKRKAFNIIAWAAHKHKRKGQGIVILKILVCVLWHCLLGVVMFCSCLYISMVWCTL